MKHVNAACGLADSIEPEVVEGYGKSLDEMYELLGKLLSLIHI